MKWQIFFMEGHASAREFEEQPISSHFLELVKMEIMWILLLITFIVYSNSFLSKFFF
jgi:hypothetical protein